MGNVRSQVRKNANAQTAQTKIHQAVLQILHQTVRIHLAVTAAAALTAIATAAVSQSLNQAVTTNCFLCILSKIFHSSDSILLFLLNIHCEKILFGCWEITDLQCWSFEIN